MNEIISSQASFEEIVQELKAQQKPFAIATVVRVHGSTSANPGAKAILNVEGSVIHGWLGGGCARGAVAKATQEACTTRAPTFVSIAPDDHLSEKGVKAGDNVDGIRFASNGCPSKGSLDVFVEPILPSPSLAIIGRSPIAKALAAFAPSLDWIVSEDLLKSPEQSSMQAVVIATQGQGDLAALKAALSQNHTYVAFVGSVRKFASLRNKLLAEGISDAAIKSVRAPAGLDIGAVTPEEIAVSVLADLIKHRRNRGGASDA